MALYRPVTARSHGEIRGRSSTSGEQRWKTFRCGGKTPGLGPLAFLLCLCGLVVLRDHIRVVHPAARHPRDWTTPLHDVVPKQKTNELASSSLEAVVKEEHREATVNWSQYAYTSYVTDELYLCNSVLTFEALHRLGTKADKVLMFPREWQDLDPDSPTLALVNKAHSEYGVQLQPIQIQRASEDIT